MRDNFVAGRYLISGDDVLDADEENDRANKRQTEGQDGVALSSVSETANSPPRLRRRRVPDDDMLGRWSWATLS